jgi:Tat protein translocase TatB subunit
MVSVGFAEILTILLVVLIVFGPRRLPELARRAGRMARDVRSALAELRDGLESDQPSGDEGNLGDLRRRLGPTLGTDESSRGDDP